MTLLIPPVAAAVPVPALPYVNLGPLGAGGLSSRGAARASATGAATVTVAGRTLRRLLAALGDLGAIVLLLYAFPVVILAVGTPIALLVRLGMWVAGGLQAVLLG